MLRLNNQNMTNLLSLNNQTLSSEVTKNLHFDGLTVGTTHYRTVNCDESMHFHTSPTVCFLLHGGGTERRKKSSYERFAYDVRFYHTEELHHSNIKIFPSKCVNLELQNNFLNRYSLSEQTINLAVTQNLDIKFLMLKIYNELLINDDFTDTSIKISLLSMLNDTKSLHGRKKPKWVINLYELLNDRWCEQISLEDLSKAVNIHPTTISKHFTKYFACTFGEYMRKLKISKSIFLIRNTNFPLTEIALQCGFADQSHFTRNFKKMTGFLPKKFKQL